MEDLTNKTQHLEAELEKTTQKLKEVTAIAVDEAEKCKSAKEAIKSLTAQVKFLSVKTVHDSLLVSFFSIILSLIFTCSVIDLRRSLFLNLNTKTV